MFFWVKYSEKKKGYLYVMYFHGGRESVNITLQVMELMRCVVLLLLLLRSGCGLTVNSSTSDVNYPMQVFHSPDGFPYVGSDPANCSVKDPNGNKVGSGIGYVSLPFSLGSPQLARLEVRLHAPDAMSDSFWVMMDGKGKQMWSTARFTESAPWGTDVFSPGSLSNSKIKQTCHFFTADTHTVRLYVREPGAGLEYVEVLPAPEINLTEIGCNGGCAAEGGSVMRIHMEHLCGPDLLEVGELSVTVGTAELPCADIVFESASIITCIAPASDQKMTSVTIYQGNNALVGRSKVTASVVYNEPPTTDNTTVIAASVGGALALALAAGLCVVLVNRRSHTRRLEAMYGANVIAAEMAEAIAILDFNALNKLDDITDPDRVQTAMKTILVIMKEFVKHIPQHVIKTVRGEAGTSQSEFAKNGSPSQSNCTSSANSLSSSAGGGNAGNFSPHARARGLSNPTGLATLNGMVGKTNRRIMVLSIRSALAAGVTSDVQQNFLVKCLFNADVAKGCVHKISEDGVVVTWGAVGAAPTGGSSLSISRVLRAASGISEAKHHCGVYSSSALCCYLGNSSSQTFHVLGGAIAEADVLCRAAQATGAPILTCSSLVSGAGEGCFILAPFFSIVSSRGQGFIESTVVFSLHNEAEQGGEWMYCLEATNNRKGGPEAALKALFEQKDVAASKNEIDSFMETAEKQCKEGFPRWLSSAVHGVCDMQDEVQKSATDATLEVTASCNTLLTHFGKTLVLSPPVSEISVVL